MTQENALKAGDPLDDGTKCIYVDLRENKALLVPASIFGGKARFWNQNSVVARMNEEGQHGHRDWRLATGLEADLLADNWAKVAPRETSSIPADKLPLFWRPDGYSREHFNAYALRVRNHGWWREGEPHHQECRGANNELLIAVVRSVPARS